MQHTVAAPRYRWPLNFHRSNTTPDYYANLGKPILAWTLDDVLESISLNDPTSLNPNHASITLTNLRPERARRFNQHVARAAAPHIAAATEAAKPFAYQTASFLDLIAEGFVTFPGERTPSTPHPEPDPTFFPPDDGDENVVCLYRPIFQLNLADLYSLAYPHITDPLDAVAERIQGINPASHPTFDHVVDWIAEAHEDNIVSHLSDLSQAILPVIRQSMDTARTG